MFKFALTHLAVLKGIKDSERVYMKEDTAKSFRSWKLWELDHKYIDPIFFWHLYRLYTWQYLLVSRAHLMVLRGHETFRN